MMNICTSAPLCQWDIAPDGGCALCRDPELIQVLWTACQVLGTQGLRRGEKSLAERIVTHITIRQKMPDPADVRAIDDICDRVLAGMTSGLAHLALTERKARRALIDGAS